MWMFPVVPHLSGDAPGPAQPSIEGDFVDGLEPGLAVVEPIVRS